MSKKLITLITLLLLIFVLFLTPLFDRNAFAQIVTTTFGYPHISWTPYKWTEVVRKVTKERSCDYASTTCAVTGKYHTGIDSHGTSPPTVINNIGPGILRAIQNNTPCGARSCKPTSGCDDHGMGNSVIIEHTLVNGDKVSSVYAHLDSFSAGLLSLQVGECVPKNFELGIMGSTGYGLAQCWGTTPHLHLELKTLPILSNPIPDPNRKQPTVFGYASVNPDLLGYLDPKLYINNISSVDCSVTPTPTPTPGWISAPDMTVPRYGAKDVRLTSGKVLILGGTNSTGSLLSPEIFDPNGNGGAGSWTAIQEMITPRRMNAGVVLLSSGKVLVAGGSIDNDTILKSVEIFDPDTNNGLGSWSSAPDMINARYDPGIALLSDGRVLVAGGNGVGSTYLDSSEIFDPNGNGGTGSWTTTDNLPLGGRLELTTLNNGKVLGTGGWNWSWGGSLNNAEIFDPNGNGGVGSWTATANMFDRRDQHTATLLPNGKVLVIGGESPQTASWTAEIFDSDGNSGSGSWTLAPALENFNVLFYKNRATLLPNGTVLVIGFNTGSPVPMAKVFDPIANNGAGKWIAINDMSTVRIMPTLTLLQNGKVLVAGGYVSTTIHSSAEIYTP